MENYNLPNAGILSAVGNLNHTGIVNCSLLITWTAPYTLQGVPIHYYTINITRHSDGAVVWSDTTNTTEYYYSVISQLQLGETLEAVVAAVNDVGTGATANITILPPAPSKQLFCNWLLIKNYVHRINSSEFWQGHKKW